MAEIEPMDDDKFADTVKTMIDDAVDYIDGFVAPARAIATAFYRGDKMGNEEEGRSQIVMTEVRDVVQAIVPSLLRVFTSGENAVEYEPRTAQGVESAEQATDYANYIFYSDNDGFSVLHNFIKDALIRKLGVIKWRWSKDTEISEAELTGLGEAQMQMLGQDETVQILDKKAKTVYPGQPAGTDPATGQPMPAMPPVVEYDVTIKRTIPKNKCVIEAIPPEEFLLDRDARNLDTAYFVGHRSLKTISELVAMGYDRDELEEFAGQGDVFTMNYEAQTRNPASLSFVDDSPDPAMRRMLYVESYIRIDKDGDGIAELRRVCTIGNSVAHVLHEEIATDVPFAIFCPDPEPHMVIGQSVADQVMDLQILKTGIVRNTMDSLAQTIHPRTVVVEGQVNMDDVMNVETGAIIRARAPGMVQPLTEPFVGQNAMPIIAYLDDVRAQRTGVSKASQGLDPDVLQSTTKTAVDATVQGAQERMEMLARIMAETGMKRLFKGILKLLCRHQDKPRMLRLRGKWVEVDPRYWDAEMDVHINVGLGRGQVTEQLQTLIMVAQKQEQIIQMLGPSNILCDISQLRYTYGKILEISNQKATTQFFKNVSEQDVQRLQQASQGKQPSDPTVMLAQIEQQKVASQNQLGQQKLQLDWQEAQMTDARERDKTLADVALRNAELQAKGQSGIDMKGMEHRMSYAQNFMDHGRETVLKQMDQQHEKELKAAELASQERQARTEAHAKHVGDGLKALAVVISKPKKIKRNSAGRAEAIE